MRACRWLTVLALPALAALACVPTSEHEPAGFQMWESPQTNPMAMTADGKLSAGGTIHTEMRGRWVGASCQGKG